MKANSKIKTIQKIAGPKMKVAPNRETTSKIKTTPKRQMGEFKKKSDNLKI